MPICWAGVEVDGCSIAGDALKLNRRALRPTLPALWDFDVPADPPFTLQAAISVPDAQGIVVQMAPTLLTVVVGQAGRVQPGTTNA